MAGLLDVRETLPRMVLLDCSGLAYLLFIARTEHPPTTLQWVLAVAAFGSALVLHRRQPVNLLVQAVLLAAALAWVGDPTVNRVGAAWAVGELALWAPRTWQIVAGTGLVAAVVLAFDPPRQAGKIVPVVVGLVLNLALPVLFGLVLRAAREVGVHAQRRLESELRAARADERNAIARELHDVVAHHVASMVLRVGVARHVLPDLGEQTVEVFDDVHRTGTSALADLRRLVSLLRDAEAGRGDAALTAIDPSALPAALDGAVEAARWGGIVVEAEIDPGIVALDAVRGLAVLRLTQEALTNVTKHAGEGARASLRVVLEGADVSWSVQDDGGGLPAAASSGGHGLIGMRERAELLGGTLTAGPSGAGWRVATVLPAAS